MTERITDRAVLLAISCGLIAILLTIVIGIYLTPRAPPGPVQAEIINPDSHPVPVETKS